VTVVCESESIIVIFSILSDARLLKLANLLQFQMTNYHTIGQQIAVILTRNSAVADKPRDALCLSVVSFRSVIPLLLLVTSALDLQVCTIKFCSVVFGIMLRVIVLNTSLSISCDQQTLIVNSDECRQPATQLCITLGCRTVDNMQLSQILVENRDFSLPHLHSNPVGGAYRRNIAITSGMEKLEWCG